jgi:SAM-dependent methyltransferase
MNKLQQEFGNIDVYLFDQLLKGRIELPMRILDAGCGGGRNLVYFLRNGFDVYGIDVNPASIESVRKLTAHLSPELSPDNFQTAGVDDIPFPDANFDVVISSAVLHFADDEAHFDRMLDEMWRVLKPGGMFFARLASTMGIEALIELIDGRRYHLPDGSTRFLVDENMLAAAERNLGADRIEPLKTTNVENLRCMTTWVLAKPS